MLRGKRNRRTWLRVWAAVGLLCLAGQTALAANKAKVDLLASIDAVAPGTPFDVALPFTMEEDWHIYWKNPITGVPPKVEWTLPDGFEAGPIRFPLPTRKEKSGVVSNLLDADPILLVTLTPPPSLAPSREVTLKAKLKWLVCKEQCLVEEQTVSLSLPVVTSATEVKPANERLFKRARRALPVSNQESKYVTVKPSVGRGKLAPGSSFEVRLDVSIKHGFHIQSNKPLMEGLVPTDVFVDLIEPLFFDPPVFPEPKVRNVANVGKLSEYDGEIPVRIPAEADTQLPGDSLTIGGVLVYQACNEQGTCYPKMGVEWSLDVPISHADAADAGQGPALAGTAPPTAPGVDATSGGTGGREPPVSTGEGSPRAASTGADATVAQQADPVGGIAVRDESSGSDGTPSGGFIQRWGLWALLGACFLYGLALNATPCVLPLLSIKVLGFVQQAHESRRRTTLLGLAFGAGVILFFVLLGLLASRGGNVLQYPSAVIALGAIVMALALSMLGVYTLQAPAAANKLDATLRREGMWASFGKGALAPVLGFACTGPFLAGVFGWATQQEPRVAVLSFLFAGLGMASPYVLLGANPKWLSFIPKPGNWMITFERVMGFLLLGMVIWLIHPLITHVGAEGLEWTLGFFLAVAMACWVLGKINMGMPAQVRWRYRGVAGVIVLAAGVLIYGWAYPLDEARAMQDALRHRTVKGSGDWSHGIPWRTWSPAAVREAALAGHPVFVDFTAAYCTNCKLNKKVAIETDTVKAKMQELDVVPFQADFTGGDPEIFEAMQAHGVNGPPLNVIYPPGQPDKPIVLRTLLLNAQYLVDQLEAAAGASNVLASAPAP